MITANANPSEDSEDFTQGIRAVIVEKLPSPEEEKEKSDKIIEEAKAEAKRILEQARQEAEKIKNDTYSKAQKKGYEDGLQQGNRQNQQKAAELEAKAKKLQKEYESYEEQLEPKMVEIISGLLEKLTGILTEDRQEVIAYLVSSSLKDLDNCSGFTLRVSKEDYDYLTEKRDLLLSRIGRNVTLEIREDAVLKKNQCLIETDIKVIDCSLDVQLKNLITDLKMLSQI
jgi:flagellar assembly protein FliH